MKPRILKPGDVVKYNQRAHDIIPNVIDNNRHTVAVVTNLPDWEEIEFTDGDICDGRWLKPVSMIRDNQKHIILYSDDLVRPSKDKSINSIDLTDFQGEALSVEDMRKASTIVYQSDDGDVKILKDKENGVIVNYTSTLRDECASSFIAYAYCFQKEGRSLIFAPLVYSQVPYEVLMSYTDNANIQIIFQLYKSLTSHPR